MGDLPEDGALEPAIPAHLTLPRIQRTSAPEGFVPSTPSFSARYGEAVSVLPRLFLGIQHFDAPGVAARAALHLEGLLKVDHGPAFWDRSEHLDEAGATNVMYACYWINRTEFRLWAATLPSSGWHMCGLGTAGLGFFYESFSPGVEDVETTFSHQRAEASAVLAAKFSETTDSHGYWGSARDRIPRAQVDALASSGHPLVRVTGCSCGRSIQNVEPPENLVLLRSGQDWSDTAGDERSFYLAQVKPVLEAGMSELCADDGRTLGCYFNRYVTLSDQADAAAERTYSLSAWRSMSDLERWVRGTTHLAIFASGIENYRRAAGLSNLRLYHELSVLHADDQTYRYIDCHPGTGMLKAASWAIQPESADADSVRAGGNEQRVRQ